MSDTSDISDTSQTSQTSQTDKILEALSFYMSSSGYRKINDALLNVSSTEELKGSMKKTCQRIEEFLMDHPISHDMIVYRGLKLNHENDFSAIKFGGKHIVRTFMSTSKSIDVAMIFKGDYDCCLLEIKLKKGIGAFDLTTLFYAESEILVSFGGILEYKGKRTDTYKGKPILIYECEYRPNVYVQHPHEFKLLTFNLFNNMCKKHTAKSYVNQLYDFDIICTQEDTEENSFSNFSKIEKCGDGNEIEHVYYNQSNIDPPVFVNCITDGYNRTALLFRYKGLLIANIHMEGGRFIDEQLCSRPIEIQTRKMKLLDHVIQQSPDMIVGDFNSVYGSTVEQFNSFLESQYAYFDNLCRLEKEVVIRWNKEPFDRLIENGYTYAVPLNEQDVITNARGKTIVDMIWYKKSNTFRLENTQIFPLILKNDKYDSTRCSFSDHNPLYTTVILT